MPARVFVDFNDIYENTATITGSDVNYLKNVLRLKIGSEITVLDSSCN